MSLNALELNLVESAATQTTAFISFNGEYREVQVIKFTEGKGDALVFAKCLKRNAFRTFSLSKIVEVINTNRVVKE